MLMRALGGETKSVVSLEFALVAPILLTLTLSGVDTARMLLISQQLHNAANAVAEAAEKLSVTTDATTGVISSELTADQMQQAMSVIYAEIPGLNLGRGGGLFGGQYSVALSSIGYTPVCTQATGCGTQTAFVHWSSMLSFGGMQLLTVPVRTCNAVLTQVARFAETTANWTEMPSPVVAGGQAMTLAPQIVADVAYSFTPYFPFFIHATQLVASATMPPPIGGLDQSIALNTSAATGNVVFCK